MLDCYWSCVVINSILYEEFILKLFVTAARAEGGGRKVSKGNDTDCSTWQWEIITHLPGGASERPAGGFRGSSFTATSVWCSVTFLYLVCHCVEDSSDCSVICMN